MPTTHPPVYGAGVSKLPPRRLVDVLLVLLVVVQLVELFATRQQVASVAVVVLMVVGTGALLLRARVPLPSVALAVGGFAALIQLVPASLSSTFFALLVVVGVIGSLSGPAAWLGLVGAWGIAFEGAWLDRYGGGVADFAMSAAIMAGAWVCGRLIGHGARAAAASAERVAAAERSRTEAASLAVREERARMTRELHDVVAHGLTVLVVQSVAAQQDLVDGAPGGAGGQAIARVGGGGAGGAPGAAHAAGDPRGGRRRLPDQDRTRGCRGAGAAARAVRIPGDPAGRGRRPGGGCKGST